MKGLNRLPVIATAITTAIVVTLPLFLNTGCSGTGRSYTGTYGRMHYDHYYGYPWRGYYRPGIVLPPGGGEGEVDPDWGVEAPGGLEAMPMPDMGMPDFGGDMGMGMDLDFGGFDL